MNNFTFNISLSVLNHLGRNLYRSFITVLGEAISNSWDAEADNVWIYLNRDENYLIVKDDGNGMSEKDFQDKFLKIGYTKRKEGINKTAKKQRPYIGRKGIGKLALLSCAERVSIISKQIDTEFIGGTIDNSGLNEAIDNDLTPQEYPLESIDVDFLKDFTSDFEKGTIIHFENIQDGVKNTELYFKKVIALYFRFSLVDDKFQIHFNDEPITFDNLDSLSDNSQFLWKLNQSNDPFVLEKLQGNTSLRNSKTIDSQAIRHGFIASVIKPRNLKILTTEEKVGIDLFVNGRLREKDILKHIPSARIAESYLYGQIHCDYLDDEVDRFTSSREGLISDDKLFQQILSDLKRIIAIIIEDWDKWRVEINQDGDSDNPRISKKERKSRELYNTIADDYIPTTESTNFDKVENWVKDLADDAQFNFSSYGECFVSENLIRKYIEDRDLELSPEALREIEKWKRVETESKNKGNISIEVRRNVNDLSYLSMNYLAYLVDMKNKGNPTNSANLSRDADEYKPIRDALAHTALLTKLAKLRLTSTYENIKARIKKLIE